MAARRLSPPAGRRLLAVAAVALVAALGFAGLHHALAGLRLDDLRAAVAAVPPARIAAAVALTIVSYAALSVGEQLALRAIGRPLPWRVGALGAFTGYAVSYNLGLPLLTGGSARYRVYRAAGLSIGDIARLGALGAAGFWGAVALLAGVALVAGAQARIAGALLIAAALTLPLLRATGRKQLAVGRWRLPLPDARRQAALGGVALLDLSAAAAALFVLLPQESAAAFLPFFLAYAVAIVAALISHVPGGLGVFETAVLAATPGDRPAIVAALLLYRLIYYVLPLLVAATLLLLAEARRLRAPLDAGLRVGDRVGQALAPSAATLIVFGSGLVLLVSGALPGVEHRLSDLDGLIPLPFVEVSHLGGSLVGTALLLVAPALNARLRSGLVAARPLLLAGALFSLGKGLDWEEALVQLAALGVLHYARAAFYRTGGGVTAPLGAGWLLAAGAALALSVWAGFFAYRHIPYSDELWWRFAFRGDAPRFLRASVAAGVLLACAVGWRALGGGAGQAPGKPLSETVAARAIAAAPRSDAQLAFTGDKAFVVSGAGDAFLMYRIEGRTWVVMGDPVGPAAAWPELVWAIRRACDAAAGRLVLYQISAAMLPLTVELGLDVIKYGEEAHVDLAGFSLAGPRAKDLRHALRRGTALGLDFAVAPANDIAALLPALCGVSDAWLAAKTGGERRFSVGPFQPAYLGRYPCAVVRHQGRIVAFANIWSGGTGEELSVDLMRHAPDAPSGTMDLLFANLLLWGQRAGYRRFNLGLAPLSGLPRGPLAPLWAKVGQVVFDRGERFYGFSGLHRFKAKFRPTWEPRYIARPRGLAGWRALAGLVRVVNS